LVARRARNGGVVQQYNWGLGVSGLILHVDFKSIDSVFRFECKLSGLSLIGQGVARRAGSTVVVPGALAVRCSYGGLNLARSHILEQVVSSIGRLNIGGVARGPSQVTTQRTVSPCSFSSCQPQVARFQDRTWSALAASNSR